MFATKEAEDEAKKVPVKTFTPGEVQDVPDNTKTEKPPRVVAPTPEQITAIKVKRDGIISCQILIALKSYTCHFNFEIILTDICC